MLVSINQGSYKVFLLIVGGLVWFAVFCKVLSWGGLPGGPVGTLVVAEIAVEQETHHC